MCSPSAAAAGVQQANPLCRAAVMSEPATLHNAVVPPSVCPLATVHCHGSTQEVCTRYHTSHYYTTRSRDIIITNIPLDEEDTQPSWHHIVGHGGPLLTVMNLSTQTTQTLWARSLMSYMLPYTSHPEQCIRRPRGRLAVL